MGRLAHHFKDSEGKACFSPTFALKSLISATAMPIYDKPFEPVRDPSAFRRYLQGCRVLGCCFVKPLSGAQPLRDRRWSPYSLYSVACLGVMWQLVLRSAVHYVARGNLDSSAYAVLGLLYLAQSSVTFVSMVVCAQ
ncbi:hypothetical protein V5799_032269, partial [Amblyomma americanum]